MTGGVMTGGVMDGPQVSWCSISVHISDGTRSGCHNYPHTLPILYVTADELHLTLTSAARREPGALPEVTDADVRFARELVGAAGTYLAELERLRSERSPSGRIGDDRPDADAAA